ncbi:MAG: D-alanine--D-alanine ligase [Candidatus Doudnabacteria bacterium]|nr:D-alanine--D-alanine ligase [Candidatus Doudnabacteria bacterium]
MKKTIGVIFGGQSAEHEVSIITAHVPIIQSLLALDKYEVIPIYIAKDGSWYSDQQLNKLSFFQSPGWEENLKKFKKLQVSLNNGFEIIWPGLRSIAKKIDIVFPAMHGTNGEDGSLMGLLRMANVPFVGCDVAASAVAMDKALTKQVLESQGILVTPYVWFTASEWEKSKDELLTDIKKLSWPLFIKPVHLGSSIGISKVKNETELINGIEVALHYDDKVLVEDGVQNLIEVTLPLMGNEDIRVAEVERPLNKTEFFDFSDKYLSGGTKSEGANSLYSEIPANIDDNLINQVKELGKRTFKILGCTGIVRVDFLINKSSGKIYVNEVNTLPGSLYHHNWRKAGVSNIELVENLVILAEQHFTARQRLTFSFQSDILKKVSGSKMVK